MKNRIAFPIVIALLTSLACRALSVPFSSPTAQPTSIPTPNPTSMPTLEPVTEKSLAGLLIASPVFGMGPGPYMGDMPVRGLGIVNRDGQLVQFAEAGFLADDAPIGPYLVYQSFEQGAESYGKLRAFDVDTGQTMDIADDLKGEKRVLGWHPSTPEKFIYTNDLLAFMFEAYGYFEGSEILLADASTGGTTVLLEHTFQSDLSPDRTKLAYATGQQNQEAREHMQEGAGCFKPRILDVATSASSAFDTSPLTDQPLCMGYPNWSPDGKWLAWVGYFSDDTFRTVIFETSTGKGTVYEPLNLFASGQSASSWNLWEVKWLDEVTFLAQDYQIDIVTGEVSAPDSAPVFNEGATRPDGLVSANLEGGVLTIVDGQGTLLGTFSLDELYGGETDEYGFDGTEFMVTTLINWAPFAPAGNSP